MFLVGAKLEEKLDDLKWLGLLLGLWQRLGLGLGLEQGQGLGLEPGQGLGLELGQGLGLELCLEWLFVTVRLQTVWQFELNGQIVVLLPELLLLQSCPSRHAANPLQTPCWGNRQDFHQGTGHKNKLGHAASGIHWLIHVHCELSWYPSQT